MNPDETSRLAALGSALRADWPAASLRTFIARHLEHRAYGDVAVALTWVATKTKTQTPRLLLEPGIWWQAAQLDGTSAPQREPFDRGSFCAHCHQPEGRCRRAWADDHEFESVHAYEKRIAAQPTRPDRRKAREDA